MKTMLRHFYEIYVRATPEQIWRAITDGELTHQYFFNAAVESEFNAGARLRYVNGGELMIDGDVLESVPPRKLVHTFKDHFDDGTENDPPSRVTWEIEPLGEECRVTLVHDGFESTTRTFTGVQNGWPPILSGLKTLVETGSPLGIAWPEGSDIRKNPETKDRAQVHQVYIRATPQRVWDALTSDEHMAEYFPGRFVVDEWKPGAAFRWIDGQKSAVPVTGTILEYDEPHRLSYSFENRWDDNAAGERPSRVTYELTPMGDACRLIVVHDDFDETSTTFDEVAHGWPSILSHMKTYVEIGKTTGA